ncbi:MAG: HD domain-containing protein, partial [Planctomycetes bacterium]|nr:HD domain-containing protein [Planctomycetota bacterium]
MSSIREGVSIDQIFLVIEKEKRMGQSGKPYGHVLFRDKSGEIIGRMWDRVEQYFPLFEVGQFARVRAEVKQYAGKPQLTIGRIEAVDAAGLELADFLPASRKDLKVLEARLREIAGALADPYLKPLLFLFLDDPEFMRLFRRVPAAKKNHHAWVGGLLEHVVSLAELAVRVTGNYPFLNADLVIAGVFFHDLGKVRELTVERMIDYTDGGRLIGHITYGYQLAGERAARVPG